MTHCQRCNKRIPVEDSVNYLSWTLCWDCNKGMANAVRTAVYEFMSIKQYKLPFENEGVSK